MKKIFQILCAVLFLGGMTSTATAQCLNTSSFGSGTVNTSGSIVTLTTCAFAGEFSTVNGVVAGQDLKFVSSAGDFITIRSGSSGGPVVGSGFSPLTVTATTTGQLFAHWNTAGCGNQSSCRTVTVQCISCTPPPPGPCTNSSQFGSATINTAGQVVTISTCSFAGEFSVVSGAVAGNDYKFASSVSTDWITVHAGSANGPVLAFGNSPLTFTSTFTGTLFPTWNSDASCGTNNTCRTTTVQCVSCLPPPPPANDDCSGAITLSCGSTVTGSTATGATPDSGPFCNTSVGTGGGVWYQVQGTGSFLTAATCGGTTNYDSKLHVYTGSCGSFTCVAGNDDACGLQSSVTWCAASGTTYFILVNGFGAAQGNFTLNLSCVQPSVTINPVANLCAGGANVSLSASFPGGTFSGPGVSGNTFSPVAAGVGTHVITYTVCSVVATTTITVLAPPANDACANASSIACNSSATGSTTCSGVDTGLPFCGTSGGSTGGNWHTFVGNGGFVNLSTCNAGTNYDTKLHVFTGSCGTLTCVAGNDDATGCGLRSRVSFCSVAGTTYYVLVSGFGSSRGNYTLDLSCTAPLAVEAGECQSRFVGYAGPGAPDDTLYICPTVSGGTGPYTTTISPAASYTCSNGCYAVAPNATTTYTISTTDGNGCSTSDQVTVNVYTVSGPNSPCATPGNPSKVQICHVPPGNPGNEQQLCVGAAAVPAHLAHGDYFGPCGNTCRSTNPSCERPNCSGGTFTVTVSGTGFLDETSFNFAGNTGGPFSFGSTNTFTFTVNTVPASFTLETQGTFNDNVASYSISCGGNLIASGSINGGQSTTQTGICCGALIAPKAAAFNSQATGIVAYPNPFSDVTTFKFRSAKNGNASILVFDLSGKQVATAFAGAVEESTVYEARFDGSNLTSGVYIYRYTNAEGKMSMGKVTLQK